VTNKKMEIRNSAKAIIVQDNNLLAMY
jgi:hypothetical protein